MNEIIYTSLYSKVCEEVGHPKPKTQEEEDYCLTCEFEHPKWAKEIRDKMKKPTVDTAGLFSYPLNSKNSS